MYSKYCPRNDRYALMEAALNAIDGLDQNAVNAIITLHQTVYKPQFESASGVAGTSLSTVLIGTALCSGVSALIARIAAAAGGASVPFLGWAAAIFFAAWAVYDVATAGSRVSKEMKDIAYEENAVNAAKETVEKNMANNPYAKYAVDAAKRTSEILMQHGGSLLDKLDAVSKTTSGKKADSTETMGNDEFAKKFGFTKNLEIVDAATAINHSKEFFYYMNGMNEYGSKVIDKAAYDEYMKGFEEYWKENRDFLPYFDEKAARTKMLKEYTKKYYNEYFLPMFRKKLKEATEYEEQNKSVEALAAEGRNEFGDIVDTDKYYASMGFNKKAEVTDLEKFSKAFSSKTGLDLSYNPLTPDGKELLERMLKNPSDEYLKYLPAPVFLMTKEDQKQFIDKARDPHRRGESQVGRYGKDMIAANEASRKAVAERPVTNTPKASGQQSAAKNDITNAPDVDKNAGQWRTVGKKLLTELYKKGNDRHRHLMRLGYILNIKNGKYYRMSDEDKQTMHQIIREDLDDVAHKHAEERRQVNLRQGRLTRADMTEDEIIESNRRAGLPDDA